MNGFPRPPPEDRLCPPLPYGETARSRTPAGGRSGSPQGPETSLVLGGLEPSIPWLLDGGRKGIRHARRAAGDAALNSRGGMREE
jgi:hypothetical protein